MDIEDTERTLQADQTEADEQRADARQLAQRLWSSATLAPDNHPYLVLWGVKAAYGLRVFRGDLSIDGVQCDRMMLMPMRDAAREMQNVAFIAVRGDWHYLTGGLVHGLYYGWGTDRDTIVISEGFVRAAKVHQDTGYAVAAACTKSNIANIVGIMHERYPASRIVLASDLQRDVHHDPAPGNVDAAADCALDVSVAAKVAGASLKASRRSRRHSTGQESRGGRPQAPVALRPLQAPELEADGKRYAADRLDDAQKLLNWISRRGLKIVTRTQVMQLGPYALRPARCAKAALLILVEHGWLSSGVGATYQVTVAALAALAEQKRQAASTNSVMAGVSSLVVHPSPTPSKDTANPPALAGDA